MDIPLFCPKKWESKKNRPLTAGKRPDAEPFAFYSKKRFLNPPPMGYKSCPLANRDCPKMRDVGRIWTFYATFGKFFHRNSRANVWQIQKVEKYFFEIGLELYFYNNSHPPPKNRCNFYEKLLKIVKYYWIDNKFQPVIFYAIISIKNSVETFCGKGRLEYILF